MNQNQVLRIFSDNMCSVDGFTGRQPFTLEQYASINQDRGPDGTNYWSDGRVHMAHSLLRIQDNPNQTSQPVSKNDKVLSYNGEIYGLEQFDTDYLFDILDNGEWSKLKTNVNGMWAFSFYDTKTETITLCRDHFGVKPLYYMVIDGELFWSSTTKPLIAALKKLQYGVEQIENYEEFEIFQDAFWLSPFTQFRYIKRLGPGQILNWSVKHRKMLPHDSLWSQYSVAPNFAYDPDEYRELAEKALRESCTAPNVKKCLSLSGGLDSTLIASLNRNQDNFFCSSVEFENYVDKNTKVSLMQESGMAKKTCEEIGLPHTSVTIDRDYSKFLPEVVERLGDVMWISSRTVPRLENIRNAKRNGAKIYITGNLADELLTGYNGHSWYFHRDSQPDQMYDPALKRFHDFPLHVARSSVNDLPSLMDHFNRNSMSEMIDWFPLNAFGYDQINNNLFIRILCSTDSFCGLTDGLAGSFGIESRVPFLHQEFAKYVMRIPSAHKLRIPWKREQRSGETVGSPKYGAYKWLIREEMKDYIPDHVLYNEYKVGFSTPWNSRSYGKNLMKRRSENKPVFDRLQNMFAFD